MCSFSDNMQENRLVNCGLGNRSPLCVGTSMEACHSFMTEQTWTNFSMFWKTMIILMMWLRLCSLDLRSKRSGTDHSTQIYVQINQVHSVEKKNSHCSHKPAPDQNQAHGFVICTWFGHSGRFLEKNIKFSRHFKWHIQNTWPTKLPTFLLDYVTWPKIIFLQWPGPLTKCWHFSSKTINANTNNNRGGEGEGKCSDKLREVRM